MSNDLVGTRDWLVAELSRSFLMDRQQLEPLVAQFAKEDPFGDASAFADFLVRNQALSRFQADRACEGEARSLVMGPYLLADPIGTGSMGTVYHATGKADRQSYAVKVLPLRSVWNVRLARRQVRAFTELPPHPAIVPFVDVGTAGGKHYLVWPYVAGETLEALVSRQGALAWHESARVAMQAAEALQICHGHSIFHGLIKPSNILIGADGTVRLLDFGIGALLAENTDESLLDTMSTANATAGMLDCASPESILDPAKRSNSGDQYSLGCVMYFCLTGRYPFPEGNMIDKMMAHQTQTPPPVRRFNQQVPSELETIVVRLMHKSAEDRFRSIDELIQELHTLLEGPRSGPRPGLTAVDTPSARSMEDTTAVRPSLATLDLGKPPSLPSISVPAITPTPTRPPSSARLRLPPIAPAPTTQTASPKTADPALWQVPLEPHTDESAVTKRLPEPERPAAPAGKPSLLTRVLGKLAFWRPSRDAVACSVLAPAVMYAGETATLPLFAHCESPETILAMGRTYFPAHQLVGSTPLRREVARGARLTFHVALPGLTLEPSVQKFAWRGQVMPLPFTVQIPSDCRPGEITGIVSVGEGSDMILNFDFRVMIGKK